MCMALSFSKDNVQRVFTDPKKGLIKLVNKPMTKEFQATARYNTIF